MAEKQTSIADVVLRGIMVGGFLIMLFVVAAMVLAPLGKVGRQPTKAERWREGRLDRSRHVELSDVVTLAQQTPAATSASSFSRMAQLAAARDHEGLNQMVLRGEAFMLQPGTRCRKIGLGFFRNEVRVLSGPKAGRTCFVSRDLL